MCEINKFDFDSRKCKPLIDNTKPNKQVMLSGVEYMCMACRRCSLGCSLLEEREEKFDPHVFSNMSYDAKVVVVAQNPGFDECMKGQPLVGQAGKNLNKALEHFGILRHALYLTNVVKCKTPKNNKPESYHKETCSKILDLELEILKPKLIVTLGGFSYDFFCPKQTYRNGLGEISDSRYGKVYAAYHPSPLCINDPEKREKFYRQIGMLSKLIKHL